MRRLCALALVCGLAVAAAPGTVLGATAIDRAERDHCAGRAERCGATVVVSEGLRGVDNCSADPNCLTRRIVDNRDPSRGTDFIPVPDGRQAGGARGGGTGLDANPGGRAGGGGPGPGAWAGGGEDVAGGGAAEGGGAGGTVSCRPRAPGRVAPDFAQVGLPQGAVAANPHFAHLTGLESWFWYEGAAVLDWRAPVFVGVAEDCSVVPAPAARTYRAQLVRLDWHVGDARPVAYRSEGPGAEARPAVRHTYASKGTWRVAVTCTWEGDWGGRVSLPCAERMVEVVEVRARLRAGH